MNTTKLHTAARTTAVALLLCVTASATTALAQGPTTPLGGPQASPSWADCPEYRDALAAAEDLRSQADVLTGAANFADDQARSIEKNLKAARASREAQEEAVRKSEARLEGLKSGELYARDPAAEIAKEEATLAGYKTELDAMTKAAEDEGALMADAVNYHHLADKKRGEAAAKRAEADALLANAAAQCGDKKERKGKKEKKQTDHSLRNGLFGAGLEIGTHFVLGGGHRERTCDGRRP